MRISLAESDTPGCSHNYTSAKIHTRLTAQRGWWLNLVWPYPSGVNDVLVLVAVLHVVVR